jgi:hypothetical protein
VIAALAGQGYDVKRCRRILGVAPSGYFGWRSRPPSAISEPQEHDPGLSAERPSGSMREIIEARIRDPKTSARDLASLTNAPRHAHPGAGPRRPSPPAPTAATA